MRRAAKLILAVAIAVIAAPAMAQDILIGLRAGVAVPTGDLKDISDPGIAVAGQLGYQFHDDWQVQLEVGYHKFSSIELAPGFDGPSGGFVPIRVGLTKFWGENFYTSPSAGVYVPVADFDDADTEFGIGPRIGLLFPLGDMKLDISAEYHNIFTDPENLNYLGFSVGIVFGGSGY